MDLPELDANSIISSADEISKLLAAIQSLMNKEVPDDVEEERLTETIDAEIAKVMADMSKL